MQNRIRLALDTMYRMYPNACCELNFNSNEQLAIAVILSAQTTDVSVNKVTPHQRFQLRRHRLPVPG